MNSFMYHLETVHDPRKLLLCNMTNITSTGIMFLSLDPCAGILCLSLIKD
jgi:hypothetical protein